MSDPDDPMWDDDTPSADPQIQIDYEAALGRFLVAFNKVDNELEGLINTLLTCLSREDLVEECTIKVDYSRKLLILDLLSLSSDPGELKTAPVSEMRQIGRERNVIAHGHFDQNPFDGGYKILGKGKYSDYSPKRLDDLTTRCNAVWDQLRHLRAYYWLDKETIEDLQVPSNAPTPR